jgi:hypothetical protein
LERRYQWCDGGTNHRGDDASGQQLARDGAFRSWVVRAADNVAPWFDAPVVYAAMSLGELTAARSNINH